VYQAGVITREDDGKVAVLRLSHGELNLMDAELLESIALEFRELSGGYARSVVITGHRHVFCAGLDLKRYIEGGADYARQLPLLLGTVFEAVFTCPLPVVAAVNGHAIGGGCVLACCADVRVMADGGGQIGLPELRVGVPFPRAALEIVQYAVGGVLAHRLALGAQTYRPKQAAELRLVDEVVPADEVLDRAKTVARTLAEQLPANTFTVTKAQLHRDAIERIDRFRDDENMLAQRLWVEHAVVDGWVKRYLDSAKGKTSSDELGS
jgi:enoyl-CoA hydratase